MYLPLPNCHITIIFGSQVLFLEAQLIHVYSPACSSPIPDGSWFITLISRCQQSNNDVTSSRSLDTSFKSTFSQNRANMSASTPTSDLALDDRSSAIKFGYPFIAVFSTAFVVLRLWNNIRSKKFWYLNVSDWLLALAQVYNTPLSYHIGYTLIHVRSAASPEHALAT